MLLNEESSPAAVLDELQQLRSQLAAHAEELARINKFQRLFKVRFMARRTTLCCQYQHVAGNTIIEASYQTQVAKMSHLW
jgi:hypothetical protein